MKVLWLSAIVALCLWGIVFSPPLFRSDRFWMAMAGAVVTLNVLAWFSDRELARLAIEDARTRIVHKLGIGLVSAMVLYAVFAVGRWLAVSMWAFATEEIGRVYALRADRTNRSLALWLVLIGAGEELFWRHYFQRRLGERFGATRALFVQAVVYAGAHAVSGNVTLMAAAAVAGTFWGVTYARWRSPLLNAVSHAGWDLMVFLVFPFAR